MDQDAPKKTRIITDQVAENITRVEELAYEIRVREVMTADPKTVTVDTPMQDLVDLFRRERISGSPVVEGDRLIGIVSIEDLIRCLMKADLSAGVGKYMTSADLITINVNDTVIEALKRFVGSRVGRLPVVDSDNKLRGILTKGDITRGILRALEKDYQMEEIRRYRASHLFEDINSDRTSLILRYNIYPRDFTHGGAASSDIKRALIRLGAPPQIARRCGIAVYEAEMNLIIHTTDGGVVRVEIEPHQISVDVYDYGPGIQDIEQALKPGFSTASEEIRELGFGAGMGLVNISRCVDWMKLESAWGKGTRLRMKIRLEKESMGEGHKENSA